MNKIDAQLLAQNLNGLAEVFDKKPVSGKALEVWFDTLREFPTERVMDKLIHWPKTHSKFPVPSEVWKELNETSIDRRESAAAAEKARYAEDERFMGRTEQGRAVIAGIYRMLAARPVITGGSLARRMLERQASGETLSLVQLDFIKANTRNVREREPGDDDEPLSVASQAHV